MMKVKVLKSFIDKHTRKVHKTNAILNITEERFEEIVSVDKGLVEVVADEAPAEKKKAAKKATKKETE